MAEPIIPAPEAVSVVTGDLSENLEVPSSLKVGRNVLPGLKFSVQGDLTVDGDIGDSEIVVSGNLKCGGRVLGGGKNRIVVHGHLFARRLERACIECGKAVTVEEDILGCSLKAKDTVVAGRAIAGGEVLSTHGICAGHIGTGEGLETRVGTGVDFKLKIMLEEMDREIEEVNSKLVRIRDSLRVLEERDLKTHGGLPFFQKKTLESSKSSLDILEKQVKGLYERRGKTQKKIEKITGSFIEVKEKIHPNTTFSIQNRYILTKKEYPAGRYTIKDDKIARL